MPIAYLFSAVCNNLPLSWLKDPGYGVQELITTYLTTAKPEDIENVYSEKLLEEGWWRDTDATRSGISFVYSRELVKIAHSIIRITTESLRWSDKGTGEYVRGRCKLVSCTSPIMFMLGSE